MEKTCLLYTSRELDDDQAVVAMVDSNLHRENLKPSEKAFAYKMKLDAMKHQGKHLDSCLLYTSRCVYETRAWRDTVQQGIAICEGDSA